MALDIKLFAPVARATNAIYMYVTKDAWTAVKQAHYFDNKELVGSVKEGDMILVNGNKAFGVLLVGKVDVKAGTIATTVATMGA